MAPESLDSRTLRAIASEHGVTARSLELWRSRGLLPAPARQPKGRAVWLYPPGTERQLERLLHWRSKTRSLSLIAIVLWIEAFPIDVERIRTALGTVTDQMASELDPSGDIPAFIDQQARKLAAARGKNSFPRIVKMKSAERIRACGYLLAVALDAEDEIERREEDAVLVERMLGLRSGQRGGLANKEPFIDAVRSLRPVMAVGKVREALASATDEQLELTRLTARLTSVWMPLLLPEMLAEYSAAEANPLRKLAEQNVKDPAIEVYAMQIIHQLLAMHERQPEADELAQAIAALQSVTTDLAMLSIFPADKRREVLSQLPAETRQPIVSELRRRHPRLSDSGAAPDGP
jgi:DNA-binding transcriptional MerR regulator